jgi:hypothetical protein
VGRADDGGPSAATAETAPLDDGGASTRESEAFESPSGFGRLPEDSVTRPADVEARRFRAQVQRTGAFQRRAISGKQRIPALLRAMTRPEGRRRWRGRCSRRGNGRSIVSMAHEVGRILRDGPLDRPMNAFYRHMNGINLR